MRISQENENKRRAKSDQSQTPHRPQAPLRLEDKSFPKSARILSRSHYQHLYKQGERHFGNDILIDFRQGRTWTAKLGISVSKRFGKAHERNYFKRAVREAFRELRSILPHDLELNVSPKKAPLDISPQAILADLKALLQRIL